MHIYICMYKYIYIFSNRAMLVNQSAPRALRLRLFNSLVTACIRWSLCVLPVTQTNLHKLRVLYIIAPSSHGYLVGVLILPGLMFNA